MNRNLTVLIGVGLIIVGAFMLLGEYNFFPSIRNFRISWPIILIIIGGAMVMAYHSSKPSRQYLHGGFILIALGLAFYWIHDVVGSSGGYRRWWPLIIIAIGAGQFIASIYGPNDRRSIVSGVTGMAIGGVLLTFSLSDWQAWSGNSLSLGFGIILLLLGVSVFSRAFLPRGQRR